MRTEAEILAQQETLDRAIQRVFELHAYMRENNLLPAVNNLIEEDESEPSDFINDEI